MIRKTVAIKGWSMGQGSSYGTQPRTIELYRHFYPSVTLAREGLGYDTPEGVAQISTLSHQRKAPSKFGLFLFEVVTS